MSLSKTFSQQSPRWIFVQMLAALVFIGVLDYWSGFEVRLLPFYAGPIFVVAWFCDRKLAMLTALLAGALSLTADWLDADPDLRGYTQIWEVIRHFGSGVMVALVGFALRGKRDIAVGRIALLEHSQRLEREILRMTDAEQRRIGQDLHDGLCQYLAALSCSAASLHGDLEELNLTSEAAAAGELAILLQDAVVQTRDLARGLVPAHVAQVGLSLALESLTQSVTRLQGVNCTFEAKGGKNFNDFTAKHLYRVAQEAISNATRHGKARNITVSLEAVNGLATLRILDDGVGFAQSKVNGSGLGLNLMRYRARLNGGELSIEQPAAGGTLILCTAKTNGEGDSNETPAL
jgi:signal transduction histidine kinase